MESRIHNIWHVYVGVFVLYMEYQRHLMQFMESSIFCLEKKYDGHG